MRFPSFSLRASVIAQLSFLILAAMLLCDVVMIRFAERDLIRARIQEARLLGRSLEGLLTLKPDMSRAGENGEWPAYEEKARSLLEASRFDEVLITGREGSVLAVVGGEGDMLERAGLSNALQAARSGTEVVEFSGRTWAVIWSGPERVRVSLPTRRGEKITGGISVSGSLLPLYRDLRRSQRDVLLYIILDTLILAAAGMFLLSRSVVRPVQRLLKMTEEYTGGEFTVPLEPDSGSEIRQLSRSLGHMLRRLDENKKELKEHIVSLERANRDLRRAQDEIIRSEKLASVGRLAAGIAHEIGNPIGIVQGYLDLINRKDILPEERADFLARVEMEVDRISRIIRVLLDFSRAGKERPETVSVYALIRETVEMLRPQPIMDGVETRLALEASEDAVFADAGRLQQVFLNVLMNAGDALNEEKEGRKEKILRVVTSSDSGRIEVRIHDNGPGIPAGDIHQVFDPFYTTKDPGKGTGLGLSVSHRIMEDLGGTIRVSSGPGEGTTAIIDLPLRDYRTERVHHESETGLGDR
jgi:signal transduction histidine kinase